MRHKRQRLAADKVLIGATGAAGVLNAVSGVVQLVFGHWTGYVGLGCAAVCLGLMLLEVHIYRTRSVQG